jgi:hypothetical protein
MAHINIDASDLLDLLEEHSGFRTGYIDRQTGEILVTFDDYDEPEQEEVLEKIRDDWDRYLQIEPIDSHEGFRIMERFVQSLPDGENRNLLFKVLSWKKPFSNFKSALRDMGDLRQQWFDFHDKALRELAEEWLESQDIKAKLVSYQELSQENE